MKLKQTGGAMRGIAGLAYTMTKCQTCGTLRRNGHCPTCANSTAIRECGPTHHSGCACHEANWREQMRLLAATKDAEIAGLKSQLHDAMAPRWHESGDDVAFLFVGNRVFAHVRRLPKIGYGWSRGDYYPQSETDYTVPKGGQKRVAMNEARAALGGDRE